MMASGNENQQKMNVLEKSLFTALSGAAIYGVLLYGQNFELSPGVPESFIEYGKLFGVLVGASSLGVMAILGIGHLINRNH